MTVHERIRQACIRYVSGGGSLDRAKRIMGYMRHRLIRRALTGR
jgi:hypothetical protein